MNVHSSITDSTPTGSKANTSTDKCLNPVHPYNETLLSNKTERTINTDTHKDLKRS